MLVEVTAVPIIIYHTRGYCPANLPKKSPTGGPEFKQHLVGGWLDGWIQEGINWYRWYYRRQIKADSHKSAPSAGLKREHWYTLGRQVSVIQLGSHTCKTKWEEDISCFLKSWNNLCVQGWLKQKWWKLSLTVYACSAKCLALIPTMKYYGSTNPGGKKSSYHEWKWQNRTKGQRVETI